MNMYFPEPYDHENTDGFELLPAGEYIAQAIDASIAPPKSGDGYVLTLVWKILKDAHEGRQVWQNISFVHSKAGAQWHGQKMLNTIIAATGVAAPGERLPTAEPLLFKPVRLGIAIESDKNGVYPDKNRVVKVWPLGNNEAAEAASSPAPAPKPAPAAAAGPAPAGKPWDRYKRPTA
jgi:hypothetical protein